MSDKKSKPILKKSQSKRNTSRRISWGTKKIAKIGEDEVIVREIIEEPKEKTPPKKTPEIEEEDFKLPSNIFNNSSFPKEQTKKEKNEEEVDKESKESKESDEYKMTMKRLSDMDLSEQPKTEKAEGLLSEVDFENLKGQDLSPLIKKESEKKNEAAQKLDKDLEKFLGSEQFQKEMSTIYNDLSPKNKMPKLGLLDGDNPFERGLKDYLVQSYQKNLKLKKENERKKYEKQIDDILIKNKKSSEEEEKDKVEEFLQMVKDNIDLEAIEDLSVDETLKGMIELDDLIGKEEKEKTKGKMDEEGKSLKVIKEDIENERSIEIIKESKEENNKENEIKNQNKSKGGMDEETIPRKVENSEDKKFSTPPIKKESQESANLSPGKKEIGDLTRQRGLPDKILKRGKTNILTTTFSKNRDNLNLIISEKLEEFKQRFNHSEIEENKVSLETILLTHPTEHDFLGGIEERFEKMDSKRKEEEIPDIPNLLQSFTDIKELPRIINKRIADVENKLPNIAKIYDKILNNMKEEMKNNTQLPFEEFEKRVFEIAKYSVILLYKKGLIEKIKEEEYDKMCDQLEHENKLLEEAFEKKRRLTKEARVKGELKKKYKDFDNLLGNLSGIRTIRFSKSDIEDIFTYICKIRNMVLLDYKLRRSPRGYFIKFVTCQPVNSLRSPFMNFEEGKKVTNPLKDPSVLCKLVNNYIYIELQDPKQSNVHAFNDFLAEEIDRWLNIAEDIESVKLSHLVDKIYFDEDELSLMIEMVMVNYPLLVWKIKLNLLIASGKNQIEYTLKNNGLERKNFEKFISENFVKEYDLILTNALNSRGRNLVNLMKSFDSLSFIEEKRGNSGEYRLVLKAPRR